MSHLPDSPAYTSMPSAARDATFTAQATDSEEQQQQQQQQSCPDAIDGLILDDSFSMLDTPNQLCGASDQVGYFDGLYEPGRPCTVTEACDALAQHIQQTRDTCTHDRLANQQTFSTLQNMHQGFSTVSEGFREQLQVTNSALESLQASAISSSQFDGLDRGYNQLRQELERLQTRLTQLEVSADALRSKSEELQSTTDFFEAHVQQYQDLVNELQTRTESLSTSFERSCTALETQFQRHYVALAVLAEIVKPQTSAQYRELLTRFFSDEDEAEES
ncbi:hypothetical protein KC318_g434 [Hortaea werneckii]|nr:hypothetical protein KC334_g402 [Hortaea werneckii]KAI7027345.1 hypothetical protein KC355_g369 [Hortaea werneckii]KAI7676191.1 hypothetical protein KC318_g434 [Hortaea werneckii]